MEISNQILLEDVENNLTSPSGDSNWAFRVEEANTLPFQKCVQNPGSTCPGSLGEHESQHQSVPAPCSLSSSKENLTAAMSKPVPVIVTETSSISVASLFPKSVHRKLWTVGYKRRKSVSWCFRSVFIKDSGNISFWLCCFITATCRAQDATRTNPTLEPQDPKGNATHIW